MEKMTIPEKYLTFQENGIDYAKICVDITVYWKGSVFERVEGLIDFYQQVVELIGPDLRYFRTDSMDGARPLRKDSLELVPFWLRNPKAKRDIISMHLEGGAHPDEPSDRSFLLMADEEDHVGAARVMLPIEAVSESADAFADLAAGLVRKLDFDSGHGGYALNWDPEGDMDQEAKQKMYFIGKRFPGIDLSDIDTTLIDMIRLESPAIKCVNWLTLLGKELSTAVGGVVSVRESLPPECTVHELATGMLIRAGEKPDIGDRNRGGEPLKSYHSVGRLLAPFRMKAHSMIFGMDESTGGDATAEWLGRFDGD
jgi:hypothetical protein